MIDVERLGAWMDEAGLAGKGEPIDHRYVSGGSQNEIYEIRRGDLHGVAHPAKLLRRAMPRGYPARSGGIIEALDGTDVLHTAAVAVCTDPAGWGARSHLMASSRADRRWA